MADNKKGPKDLKQAGATATVTETSKAETTGIKPQDVTVPIEGASAAPTAEKEKKPAKPEIPEHLKKGNRVCAACGTTEASFMEKNPRYSLCKGVDVLCYRKGHRVLYGVTLEEVNTKYPDKVGKTVDVGGGVQKPMIESVSGIGIKPGILVRGAIQYSKKAVDTAGATAPATTSTAPGEAAGAAGTTSTG